MTYQTTKIKDVFLLTPQVFEDSRGHFLESFRQDKTLEETGFDFRMAQVNSSLSKRGVIRGIHFKKHPPGQAKFVWVSQGSILDIAIDLRRSSSTFGQWQAFELSQENNQSLLLGYGIGHAFLALEHNTKVSYLCDSVFEPEIELGLHPFEFGIDWQELARPWGITDFIISPRDLKAGSAQESLHMLFS